MEMKDSDEYTLFRSDQVARRGVSCCPICTVQTVKSVPDTGWIRCPIADDRIICLGCCFDFQAVARSKDFDSHPSLEELEVLAAQKGVPLIDVRRACLSHQIQLWHHDIAKAKSHEVISGMKRRVAEIESLLAGLE